MVLVIHTAALFHFLLFPRKDVAAQMMPYSGSTNFQKRALGARELLMGATGPMSSLSGHHVYHLRLKLRDIC